MDEEERKKLVEKQKKQRAQRNKKIIKHLTKMGLPLLENVTALGEIDSMPMNLSPSRKRE